MEKINQEQFKRDFNKSNLTNSELLKKYPFSNMHECIQYAKVNNLVEEQKPLTEEEKKNNATISKQLNNCTELLK